MKLIALILALFISFLVIKPGVDVIHSQFCDTGIECCSAECSPFSTSEDTQNQCNGKTCSLFQVCNSGVLTIHELSTLELEIAPLRSFKQDFPYQSTFRNQFIPDFWQPPKLV